MFCAPPLSTRSRVNALHLAAAIYHRAPIQTQIGFSSSSSSSGFDPNGPEWVMGDDRWVWKQEFYKPVSLSPDWKLSSDARFMKFCIFFLRKITKFLRFRDICGLRYSNWHFTLRGTKVLRNLAPKHGLFRFLTIKAPLNRVFFTAHSRNKEYCIIFFRRSRALYWYSVHKGHTDEKKWDFFRRQWHARTHEKHAHTHAFAWWRQYESVVI